MDAMQHVFAMKWFMIRICGYCGICLLAANAQQVKDPQILEVAEAAVLPGLIDSSDDEGQGGILDFIGDDGMLAYRISEWVGRSIRNARATGVQ